MAVPSKYIQSVLDAAGGRPKSTQWFRDKIKEFGEPSSAQLVREGKRSSRPFFGRLNMFFYSFFFKISKVKFSSCQLENFRVDRFRILQ